ncbi:unnamed protein product [Heterobilharzia americana]|nr:unnamed protein product [Heterobilharzia americana]
MPRLSLLTVFPGVFHSHLSTLSVVSSLPLDEKITTSKDAGLHFWLNRSSDLNFSDTDGFNNTDVANVSYGFRRLYSSTDNMVSIRNQDSSDATELPNHQHYVGIISNQANNNVISDKSGGKIMFEVVTAATASEEAFLNRSSVLFVAVSFILLMVISLAWLVFYYVQRFRYLHSKERVSRRLAELAKKAVARIPIKTLHPGDREITAEYEQCAICIEAFRPMDNLRILPCRHYFHKLCIDPWLLEQRSCPMCKLDILQAYGFRAELFCSYANLDNLTSRAISVSGPISAVSSVSTTSPGLVTGSLSNSGLDDDVSMMESVSLVTSQPQAISDLLTVTCGPPLTYVVLTGTNGAANAADSIIIHAQSCSKTNEQSNVTNSISSHFVQNSNMTLPTHSVTNSITIPLLSNLSFSPNQLAGSSMWSTNLLPVCVVTSVNSSESYQARAIMVCESFLGNLLSQTCSVVTAAVSSPTVHSIEHSVAMSMNTKEAGTSTTQSLMGPLCSTALDSEISSIHPMNIMCTNCPDQFMTSQINNISVENSRTACPTSYSNSFNSSQYSVNPHNWQIINLRKIIHPNKSLSNNVPSRSDHSSITLFRNWLSSHWRNTFSRPRSNRKRCNRLSYHTPSYYTVTSTSSASHVVNTDELDQSKSNLITAKRQSTSAVTTKECYVTAVVEDVPSETGNSSTLSESVNIPTSDYPIITQSVNTVSVNTGSHTTADIVFPQ